MLGLSLKQVREALDTQRASPATVLDDLITATRRRIAHENELLHRLETLAERRAVLTISKFPADARTRSVLTTALTDSDPGVRRHAAMALSGQGIAAAIPAPARARLAQALVEIATPRARARLGQLTGDPDPQVAPLALALIS